MSVGEIIRAVTEADSNEAAKAVIEGVRAGSALVALCDQLHIDPAGHGKAWQRLAIVAEARS